MNVSFVRVQNFLTVFGESNGSSLDILSLLIQELRWVEIGLDFLKLFDVSGYLLTFCPNKSDIFKILPHFRALRLVALLHSPFDFLYRFYPESVW